MILIALDAKSYKTHEIIVILIALDAKSYKNHVTYSDSYSPGRKKLYESCKL